MPRPGSAPGKGRWAVGRATVARAGATNAGRKSLAQLLGKAGRAHVRRRAAHRVEARARSDLQSDEGRGMVVGQALSDVDVFPRRAAEVDV